MQYIVLDKQYLESLDTKTFDSPKEAEKALRLAPEGTYMILRVVADDVQVTAPPPTVAPTNKVVIGKRTFTRRPKATTPSSDPSPEPNSSLLDE